MPYHPFFIYRLLVATSWAVLLAAPHLKAQNPSYAKQPTIVEYDVDPAWPQRPDHIVRKGWVSGLAIDSQDQIWLFGKRPDPVQVYTADGKFVRTWGQGLFSNPHHLRIGPDGNIWVADFGLHIVQKFTPEGKLLQTLGVRGEKGDDETHFNMPTDMAITPAGDIFVTDGYGNRRIVHLDKHGKFIKAWGRYGSRPGEFILPHAIVVDAEGLLYVADRNSARIQVFDQEGTFLDQWSNVIMPWGLSISGDDIWVCGSSPHWWLRSEKYPEYKDQMFVRFDRSGRVLQLWTIPLGDIGEDKNNPDVSLLHSGEAVGVHCIAEDSNGNIYLGEIYSERAQKFVPVTSRATPHQRRFIYNSDGTNMFYQQVPPMAASDVHRYIDEVADKGVTTFFYSPNVGMLANYPSRHPGMVGAGVSQEKERRIHEVAIEKESTERAIVNLRALLSAGHDPVGLILERAQAKGLEAFISYRLNEIHDVQNPDTSLIVSPFWREHPEWRVGQHGDEVSPLFKEIIGGRPDYKVHPIVSSWFPGALNFAVPEVRAERLAELRECCERYPIDGLDLDFQRFPIYFPQDEGHKHVETMTEWVRQVRAMTREVARKRGRPILLSARILAKPEQCLAIGLDPVTWAKEGLLDFVIVSHYLRNDFPLPIAEYKKLITKIPVYACIEVERDAENYRRIARELWDGGADGLAMFNFFTWREGAKKEPEFELFRELSDPEKLK